MTMIGLVLISLASYAVLGFALYLQDRECAGLRALCQDMANRMKAGDWQTYMALRVAEQPPAAEGMREPELEESELSVPLGHFNLAEPE